MQGMMNLHSIGAGERTRLRQDNALKFEANYFFDTEFIDDDFVSIGAVRDDGKTFYAESSEADLTKANSWIKKNVLVWLGDGAKIGSTALQATKAQIGTKFAEFVGDDPDAHFFTKGGGDIDWKMLGKLFGGLGNMPANFKNGFTDVDFAWKRKQGSAKKPNHLGRKHHAFDDAVWAKDIWVGITGDPAMSPKDAIKGGNNTGKNRGGKRPRFA